MANSSEVMSMIYPDGGWVAVGEDFEGIQFLECPPITKTAYNKAASEYEAWKLKVKTDKETAKAALLTKLGITAEEAKLLLS
jgi:hypothetical protein